MSLANRMGDIAASVEDPDLSRLAIMSRLGHVDLSVARGLPFQIGGRTRRGSITGVLPAWVQAVDGGESVSGSSGTGGPVVEFVGLWSSFVIREDTVPVRDTLPSAGR
jgi:hypothetical protein